MFTLYAANQNGVEILVASKISMADLHSAMDDVLAAGLTPVAKRIRTNTFRAALAATI